MLRASLNGSIEERKKGQATNLRATYQIQKMQSLLNIRAED